MSKCAWCVDDKMCERCLDRGLTFKITARTLTSVARGLCRRDPKIRAAAYAAFGALVRVVVVGIALKLELARLWILYGSCDL